MRRYIEINYHGTAVCHDEHVKQKFNGHPPAGFNVQVGYDRQMNTILFYYDRAGVYFGWGRMMDEDIHLGRNNNPNIICRPADRSLLSYDRRRIVALGFNHFFDWSTYSGGLPTRPDEVWLSYMQKGEEMPSWMT
jgi:hypothetical protein